MKITVSITASEDKGFTILRSCETHFHLPNDTDLAATDSQSKVQDAVDIVKRAWSDQDEGFEVTTSNYIKKEECINE